MKTLIVVAATGLGANIFTLLPQIEIILRLVLLAASIVAIVMLIVLRFRRLSKNKIENYEEE